jgi:hypothetical protein
MLRSCAHWSERERPLCACGWLHTHSRLVIPRRMKGPHVPGKRNTRLHRARVNPPDARHRAYPRPVTDSALSPLTHVTVTRDASTQLTVCVMCQVSSDCHCHTPHTGHGSKSSLYYGFTLSSKGSRSSSQLYNPLPSAESWSSLSWTVFDWFCASAAISALAAMLIAAPAMVHGPGTSSVPKARPSSVAMMGPGWG